MERRGRAVASFDLALEELRAERFKLEADLKTTDLRKLVLVQELALLKEFEKNDIALASRLERKHAEKSEIVSKVVPPPPSPPLPHLTSPRLASPPTTPSSPLPIHPP